MPAKIQFCWSWIRNHWGINSWQVLLPLNLTFSILCSFFLEVNRFWKLPLWSLAIYRRQDRGLCRLDKLSYPTFWNKPGSIWESCQKLLINCFRGVLWSPSTNNFLRKQAAILPKPFTVGYMSKIWTWRANLSKMTSTSSSLNLNWPNCFTSMTVAMAMWIPRWSFWSWESSWPSKTNKLTKWTKNLRLKLKSTTLYMRLWRGRSKI